MKKTIMLVLTVPFFTGCAAITGHGGKPPTAVPLAPAVDKLAAGDSAGAAKVLRGACEGKPVSGVTDEALFRLALLSLKPNRQMPVSKGGRQLLGRLKKEYPSSPWTAQAMPLMELIKLVDDISRQNRSLKAAKDSLNKELEEVSRENRTLKAAKDALNKELDRLNDSIEQLKDLDLELEKSR